MIHVQRTSKFGAYEDDLPIFDWIREGAPERRSCLEAQVMDLADDISYSVHDVEDAIVAGHFQLRWMDNPDHRARVVGYAKQWYLPHNDPAAIDAALARLEATSVWVREADGSRKSMAALKNMTSQLIGRFCQSALETTRAVYGPENLTRYSAEPSVSDATWSMTTLSRAPSSGASRQSAANIGSRWRSPVAFSAVTRACSTSRWRS